MGASTVPLKRPWVPSHISIGRPRLSAGNEIVDCDMTSKSLPSNPWSTRARKTKRPIRPNPLIPILVDICLILLSK